jgi:uncharacterized membrane protein YqjE
MTVREAWNRGNNLLATGFLAISSLAFFPDYFLESEFLNKLDEVLLLVLGLIGIGWYLRGRNKFSRSFIPIALLFLGLVVKILGIIWEISQKEDIGDDFGGAVLFVLATIVALWLYFKSKSFKES